METTNDNLIDKQLYISMQQGNKKAFDTLFIKYYAMLCAFARSFVSLEDAEEVVQDTMLQIWENRKTNHIDSSVHHYLFKAVKNKCYTFIIRKSKFPPNPERSVQFSGKRTKRSVQKIGCTQHL